MPIKRHHVGRGQRRVTDRLARQKGTQLFLEVHRERVELTLIGVGAAGRTTRWAWCAHHVRMRRVGGQIRSARRCCGMVY
jgi:hypothetical protein